MARRLLLDLGIMTTLTTIDLASLAGVTGGQCTCTPQQDAGADPGAGAEPTASAPSTGTSGGGGGFLSVIQQILGFLQSPQFTQLASGASQILGAFSGMQGSAAAPQQDAGTMQA